MKKILPIILFLFVLWPQFVAAQQCVLQESVASSVQLGPNLDSITGNDEEVALTINQADIRVSKNGGDFAQINDANGGRHDENGFYKINANTTDTNTPGYVIFYAHITGALYVKETCQVLSVEAYNNLYSNTYTNADIVITNNLINSAKLSLRDAIESQRASHTIQGDEWYVDPVNGNDGNSGAREAPFLTIGQALTDATDNNHDVIYLLAGASTGITSTNEQVTISKNYLFIRGPGRGFLWKSTSNGTVITVTGDGIELSGFHLKTHSAGSGRGIDTSGEFTWIHDLFIEQTRGDAIQVSNASWCYIENNTLHSTGLSGSGHGINIEGSGGATALTHIRNNDIFGTAGDGVRIDNSANVSDTIIKGNSFNENSGYGVNIQVNSVDTVLANNHFANNVSGDWIDNGTTSAIENNEQWAKEATIGTPANTTVSNDIASVKAETALIVEDTGTNGVVIADDAITPAKFSDAASNISYGGAVWVDDAAANETTVVGVDGLPSNPVSTLVAARTIADAIGVKRYYIINDSTLTLTATHMNWEFYGVGLRNLLSLGGQNVNDSHFFNLVLSGTQGGTQKIQAHTCYLNGITNLNVIAHDGWLIGDNTLSSTSQNIIDNCSSNVPGEGVPELTFQAGTTTIGIRHYSGGLQVNNMTSDHTMSYETDGQLIVDATCTSGNISARGNMSITDNGTTMSITKDAVWNKQEGRDAMKVAPSAGALGDDSIDSKLNLTIADLNNPNQYKADISGLNDLSESQILSNVNAAWDAANTELAAIPTGTGSLRQFMQFVHQYFRNKKTVTSTTETLLKEDASTSLGTAALSDDGTTFTKGEMN